MEENQERIVRILTERHNMELKITDVPCEMIEIGKQIVDEKRYLYTDEELENLRHYFTVFGGDYTDGGDFIYQYIYDHSRTFYILHT